MILSDLWTTLKWFLVIFEPLWNDPGVILGDSWTTLKMILGWFSVIREPLWNDSAAILGDSWNTLKMILGWIQSGSVYNMIYLILKSRSNSERPKTPRNENVIGQR